jgi:hypothetical protein
VRLCGGRFILARLDAPIIRIRLMTHAELIEQELSAGEASLKVGNDGKARVCARRAVALASEAWLAGHSIQVGRMDAMAHLRRIQEDVSVALSIRQAAERLSTTVTQRDSAPFTTDPIGDARLIIAHLTTR